MNLKSNTLVIGLGNCGCKIAKQFGMLGYSTMFANGSEQDLKVIGNMKGVYRLKGYDGFGGHREKAIHCLADNQEFTDALENIQQDIVVIIYAAGGSTGSGLSTIVAQYIKDVYEDKIVVNVPVLPAEDEAINKHKNAYQCIKELADLEDLGATFVLDNNNAADGNLNWINENFVSLLNGFLTDSSWGERNNFDENERLEMLRESGCMVIAYPKHGYDMVTSGNIFAPLQNDMVCGNVGIIHSEKNDVPVADLIGEVGKPLNVYEGYGGRKTMIAVSGLTLPLDHVQRLGQLAVQGQKERQRNQEAAKTRALLDLDFGEPVKKAPQVPKPEKKPSGRDALLAMRKRANG